MSITGKGLIMDSPTHSGLQYRKWTLSLGNRLFIVSRNRPAFFFPHKETLPHPSEMIAVNPVLRNGLGREQQGLAFLQDTEDPWQLVSSHIRVSRCLQWCKPQTCESSLLLPSCIQFTKFCKFYLLNTFQRVLFLFFPLSPPPQSVTFYLYFYFDLISIAFFESVFSPVRTDFIKHRCRPAFWLL